MVKTWVCEISSYNVKGKLQNFEYVRLFVILGGVDLSIGEAIISEKPDSSSTAEVGGYVIDE